MQCNAAEKYAQNCSLCKRHLPHLSLPSFLPLSFSQLILCIHRTNSRGEWLYGFLDWSSSLAAAWYIGLLVAFAILFVLQKYIHLGRDRALTTRRSVVAAADGTAALEGPRQDSHDQKLGAMSKSKRREEQRQEGHILVANKKRASRGEICHSSLLSFFFIVPLTTPHPSQLSDASLHLLTFILAS